MSILYRYLSDLDRDLSDLNRDLSCLYRDLSDLDRDLSYLDRDLFDLDRDLSDLDRDLSNLDRDLSDLDRDLSDLSVRRAAPLSQEENAKLCDVFMRWLLGEAGVRFPRRRDYEVSESRRVPNTESLADRLRCCLQV